MHLYSIFYNHYCSEKEELSMISKNTFIQTFKFDIRNSLRCNKWLITGCIVLFIMASLFIMNQSKTYSHQINSMRGYVQGDENYISDELHVPDYLLFLYRGTPCISKSNITNSNKTEIPVMYISLMIICCCITSRYLTSDICRISIHYSRTRTEWIISKLICNFIILFIVLFSGVLISIFYGKGSGGYNESILKKIMYIKQYNGSVKDFILLMLLFILGAYTISVIQICISLAFSYIAGLLAALVIYISSIFSNNMLFIGNACMLQRSNMFNDTGWNPSIYIIITLIILIITVVLTIMINSKTDYLNN